MSPPYPPAGAVPSRDRSVLWGVLGLVVGLFCCGIVGIVFGYLSTRDAKRHGRSPALGYLAIAVSLINIIASAALSATGNYPA